MKLKQVAIFGFFMLGSRNVSSQTLLPSVTASAGTVFSGASNSLSFTIGEMAIIETFNSPNFILTQGFQQPISNPVTAIIVPGLPDLHLKVFPNPGNGHIYLSVDAPYPVIVSGVLYDVIGRKVFNLQNSRYAGLQSQLYNWSNYINGVYLLKLVIKRVTGNEMNTITQKIIITR